MTRRTSLQRLSLFRNLEQADGNAWVEMLEGYDSLSSIDNSEAEDSILSDQLDFSSSLRRPSLLGFLDENEAMDDTDLKLIQPALIKRWETGVTLATSNSATAPPQLSRWQSGSTGDITACGGVTSSARQQVQAETNSAPQPNTTWDSNQAQRRANRRISRANRISGTVGKPRLMKDGSCNSSEDAAPTPVRRRSTKSASSDLETRLQKMRLKEDMLQRCDSRGACGQKKSDSQPSLIRRQSTKSTSICDNQKNDKCPSLVHRQLTKSSSGRIGRMAAAVCRKNI